MALEIKILSNSHVTDDFPELYNRSYLGVGLENSFYIMLEDDEILEEGYLIGDEVDKLIGKNGFKRLCKGHNVIKDRDGDIYFINRWDAEQVVMKLKKKLVAMTLIQ